MGDIPTKFLIDGIDRLGKSTLIQNIQEMLGYHLVIHYDKPKLLANLVELAKDLKLTDPEFIDESLRPYLSLDADNLARFLYQEETNVNMFELLRTKASIIFDRTHLGEMVYAPLYRGYSGDYVYALERELVESKPFTIHSDIRLVLLTTSNFDMLMDDGLSFDFSKKEQEQSKFLQAFEKSKLLNKVVIDVHDGSGGYKSQDEILEEAVYKHSKF